MMYLEVKDKLGVSFVHTSYPHRFASDPDDVAYVRNQGKSYTKAGIYVSYRVLNGKGEEISFTTEN